MSYRFSEPDEKTSREGEEKAVLFSLPSGGVLEYCNARRRGEDGSQIPNVHSVWERPSNRSKRTASSSPPKPWFGSGSLKRYDPILAIAYILMEKIQ